MKKRMIALVAACLAFLLTLVSCASASDGAEREVRSAEINEEGKLVLTYTDGTQSILGTVRGADGADGIDGKDGKDGESGATGAAGATGATGAAGPVGTIGPTGATGRGIASITASSNGNLLVTYSDNTSETVELLGNLYLFGGLLGADQRESAAWAMYSGGILVIGGTGSTVNYAEGGAPWSALIPMLTAVYVDTSDGLILGENVLHGIEDEKIFRSTVWVDMTDSAPLLGEARTDGEPLAMLPLGTELIHLGEEGDFTKVRYEGALGAQIGYVETKYTVDQNGSVVYTQSDTTVTVSNAGGANLRTFPDATDQSAHNIYTHVAAGAELRCVGVSLNERWLRIAYEDGERGTVILYCLASLCAVE